LIGSQHGDKVLTGGNRTVDASTLGRMTMACPVWVRIDDREHVLVVIADSADAAAEQLGRDRDQGQRRRR
jgi:hypothetical protein